MSPNGNMYVLIFFSAVTNDLYSRILQEDRRTYRVCMCVYTVYSMYMYMCGYLCMCVHVCVCVSVCVFMPLFLRSSMQVAV